MTYKVVVTPDAFINIEDAIIYYKEKVSIRVAQLFIQDYKRTFKEIQKTKYFKCYFEEFRGKPLKKFPYIVFYSIDDKNKVIIIKAVFNTHQNTEKYPK